MPMDDDARATAFRALMPLVASYAKRWKTKRDYDADTALGFYSVEVKGPGSPGFATLFAHLNDVRLYCYPLRIWKDLAVLLPADVKRRVISGSVFVFKTPVVTADKHAIRKLLAEGARRIDARTALAPKVPYTKKLTKQQLQALEAKPRR